MRTELERVHAARMADAAANFAHAMGASVEAAHHAMAQLTAAFAPRNLVTIHPDTIRRCHDQARGGRP